MEVIVDPFLAVLVMVVNLNCVPGTVTFPVFVRVALFSGASMLGVKLSDVKRVADAELTGNVSNEMHSRNSVILRRVKPENMVES